MGTDLFYDVVSITLVYIAIKLENVSSLISFRVIEKYDNKDEG